MDAGLHWVGLVPFGLALAWLMPLAGYDIRHREVPHIAWVGIPALAMLVVAGLRGDVTLSILTGILMVVSEVPRLGKGARLAGWIGAAISLPLCVAWTPPESLPGALFIIGSWIMFELSWWAGADALAAIALALLWPNLTLVACVAVGHLVWGLIWRRWRRQEPQSRQMTRKRFGKLTPAELEAVGAPGLPSLAIAVALYLLIVVVSGHP